MLILYLHTNLNKAEANFAHLEICVKLESNCAKLKVLRPNCKYSKLKDQSCKYQKLDLGMDPFLYIRLPSVWFADCCRGAVDQGAD